MPALSLGTPRLSLLGASLGIVLLVGAGSGSARPATHSVTITSGPQGTVQSTSASFSWSSSVTARFTCARDSAGPADCGSGRTGSASYGELAQGGHTFTVTAIVSSRDIAQARRSWTIAVPPPTETTPPETTILSAVAGPTLADEATLPLSAGVVPLNIATFTFSANEPGTFTCVLDGRAFPCVSPLRSAHLAAGPRQFEVYATDLAGNRDATPAAVSWTIGAVGATLRLPAKKIKLAFGPHRLRARDLQRMARSRGVPYVRKAPDDLEEREEEERDEPGDDECVVVGCGSPEPGVADRSRATSRGQRAAALAPTPGLTGGPFDQVTGGNDPDLAASSGFLVATVNRNFLFMNKAGKLLTQTKNGGGFPGLVSAKQFFRSAFDPSGPNLNTNLNLPSGLTCNPTVDQFDNNPNQPGDQIPLTSSQQAATANCLQDVYDSRVVFDDFRKRFWILSVVRNNSGGYFQGLTSKQQRVGHRDIFLVAVSADEDPRDGWWVYAFSSTLDLGACNTIGSGPAAPPPCPGTFFRPGDGVDFPSIGISKDYVVTSVSPSQLNPFTNKFEHAYTNIVAFSASQLAKGVCQPGCGFTYGRLESFDVPFGITSMDVGSAHAEAAVQHSVGGGGYALVVANHPELDMLLVLGFRDGEGFPPPLQSALVPVKPEVGGVPDMPQPIVWPFTNPKDIKVNNIGATLTTAAALGSHLFTAWMDCKKWSGQYTCSDSIHLVSLDVLTAFAHKPGASLIDRTFGARNQSDPNDAIVYYGNPGVEVNKNLDAVVVYNRTGRQVFHEARYSAYLHSESDIRPSAVLKRGASPNLPFGKNKSADGKDTLALQMDTGGIAVDPKDDVGIWMFHSYISNDSGVSTAHWAIGKVFGSPEPDLSILTGVGIKLSDYPLPVGSHVIVSGEISNGGDGRSKAVEGTVFLDRKVARGPRLQLARFAVPALASGGAVRFRASATLPATLAPGQYELEVVLPRLGKEYGTKNNVARRVVRVTKR